MLDSLPYQAFERDAFIRTAEVALNVGSRRELFLWMQLHLHRFVPHDLAMCHVMPLPSSRPVVEVFHSVPLAPALFLGLRCAGSPLWSALHENWRKAGRRAMRVRTVELPHCPDSQALRDGGVDELLVHGVDATSRMRPEALFVFGRSEQAQDAASCAGLDLWMPYLHACAVRALSGPPEPAATVAQRRVQVDGGASETASRPAPHMPLTAREVQVLMAVRAAKRTVDIGTELSISPLTVKNHLRKIMSKLGARSRTQAVAEAMARQIIS